MPTPDTEERIVARARKAVGRYEQLDTTADVLVQFVLPLCAEVERLRAEREQLIDKAIGALEHRAALLNACELMRDQAQRGKGSLFFAPHHWEVARTNVFRTIMDTAQAAIAQVRGEPPNEV